MTLVDLEVPMPGLLLEFYRESWVPTDHSALQGNISRSAAGSLRAMHFHRRQWDYWFVVAGEMFVALADLRAGSPTERVISTTRLSAETPQGLFIPPGVAHGFLAETELTWATWSTGTSRPDEWGIAWNDPELGIGWPVVDPVVSDRDRSNPSLSEALRDPVPYDPPVG